jgi:tetratricopeptide (TPR) repeat protein
MKIIKPIFIPKIQFLTFILFAIILAGCASEKKVFDINTVSPKEREMIEEGVRMNDRGEYSKALAKYQEVLDINPDNIIAMAECSFTYFEMNDCEKSLEYNLKALEYESRMRPDLIAAAANCYDILGEPEKAIELYEEGKKLNPKNINILFNLAIAYANLDQLDKAEDNFIETIQADQGYASAHFGLANIYMEKNEPIMALFPSLRFLSLEPISPRADMIRNSLKIILNFDPKGEDTAAVMIATSNKIFLDEEVLLQKLKLDRLNSTRIKLPKIHNMVFELKTMLKSKELREKTESCEHFVCRHYLPYFMEITKNELTDAFFYYSFRGERAEEVMYWIKQNEDKMMDMQLFNDVWEWK